jgi:hypothetical protein
VNGHNDFGLFGPFQHLLRLGDIETIKIPESHAWKQNFNVNFRGFDIGVEPYDSL